MVLISVAVWSIRPMIAWLLIKTSQSYVQFINLLVNPTIHDFEAETSNFSLYSFTFLTSLPKFRNLKEE